ncbi:MAG: DMT family transporter [Longimicrobiales bacterium]
MRWLALLGVNLFAAFCFVAIKIGLAYAPPLAFGGLRALLGGASLLIVAAATGQRVRPARQDLPTLTLLGLTATTATYGAMFGSPALMDAGLASVLGNVQPLLILVFAAMMLGEPLTRPKLLALLAGLAGVALILSPSFGPASRGAGMGAGLALTASAGAALGSILFKRSKVRTGVVATTGWQLTIGSVPLLAAAMIWSGPQVRWTAEFLGLLAFLALLGTALPTTLWFWLLQREEDAGRLSMFLFLTPVLGLASGVAVLGDRIRLIQGLGVLVIAGGLFAVSEKPRSWRRPSVPLQRQ